MSYTLQCAPAQNNAAWKLWLTSFPSTGRFSMHKEEKREREGHCMYNGALCIACSRHGKLGHESFAISRALTARGCALYLMPFYPSSIHSKTGPPRNSQTPSMTQQRLPKFCGWIPWVGDVSCGTAHMFFAMH